VLLIALSSPLKIQAEPTLPKKIWSVSCEDVIKECDKALDAADHSLRAKDAILKVQTEQLEAVVKRNAELKASRDSFFRNPLVLLLTGALVGGFTYGLVQKIP